MSGTLNIPIRQQDASVVVLRYSNTVHNRQLRDFISRNEAYSKPLAVKTTGE